MTSQHEMCIIQSEQKINKGLREYQTFKENI